MKTRLPIRLRSALLAALAVSCMYTAQADETITGAVTLTQQDLVPYQTGVITVASGASVSFDGPIAAPIDKWVNNGSVSADDSFSLTSGSLTNSSSGVLSFASSSSVGADASVKNAGLINASGTLANSGSLDNSGIVNLWGHSEVSGTVANSGTINSYGDMTLTGASLSNTGVVNVYNSASATGTSLSGAGSINLRIGGYTKATGPDSAMLTLTSVDLPGSIPSYGVTVDLADISSLQGNQYNFIQTDHKLWNLPLLGTVTDSEGFLYVDKDSEFSFINTDGYSIVWNGTAGGTILFGSDNNCSLSFTTTGQGNGLTGIAFGIMEQKEGNATIVVGTEEASSSSNDNLTGTLPVAGGGSISVSSALTAQFDDFDSKVGEDERNVVFSVNVSSNVLISDGLKVETVVATKTENNDSESATKGLKLVFQSDAAYTGTADDIADSILGFAAPFEDKDITINQQSYTVRTADVAVVDKAVEVTLKKLSMNTNLSITLNAGAVLTLAGSQVEVGGGSFDSQHTFEFESSGSTNVDLAAMMGLQSHSQITSATLVIDGRAAEGEDDVGSSFVAKLLTDSEGEYVSNTASTTFTDSVVELFDNKKGTDISCTATLGSNETGAQTLQFVDSIIKGTGLVQNISMKGGGLVIGNSPGVMHVGDSDFSGSTWTFTIITSAFTDGGTYDSVLEETGETSGAFSQLKLESDVNAKGTYVSFKYEAADAAADSSYTESSAENLQGTLAEGFGIKFIDGADKLKGSYTVDYASLPELEAGLVWDTTHLFADGVINVVRELMGDPSRIANTLVSAGETTASFGQMALSHAADPRLKGLNVWVSGFGVFLDHSGSGSRTGFEHNAGGYAVGADGKVCESTILGFGIGQSFGENKPDHGNGFFDAGSIDQDGVIAGLYSRSILAACQEKGRALRLDSYVTYGSYDNDSSRNATITSHTASASWDEEAWALGATLSYDMAVGENAYVTPFVGLKYTYADMDDFTEHGAQDIRYSASSYQSLSAVIGIGASRAYAIGKQTLTPYASIAYVGDMARQDAKVTATGQGRTIVGKSACHGRNAVQFNVGVGWQITDRWHARAGYTAELRDGAGDQNVNATVSYSF